VTFQFSDFVASTGVDGSISAEDILALRRVVWADGLINAPEIEGIFAINARLTDSSREWSDFLVEAVTNWLIEAQQPRGYIDEAQANWLIAHVTTEGNCGSDATLELLVHMLERATSAPQNLRDFTRDQAEKQASNGPISAEKAKMLRRLIFAPASDRPAGVAQSEAEMLFRIKDAALPHDNAPEWQTLFVQAVGNYLQGFGGKEPLSRDREIELERFMNDTASGFGGFFARMAKGGAGQALAQPIVQPDLVAQIHTVAQITGSEQNWLDHELQMDGQCDAMEQALLKFLAENAD
jgi:hypothetical protein